MGQAAGRAERRNPFRIGVAAGWDGGWRAGWRAVGLVGSLEGEIAPAIERQGRPVPDPTQFTQLLAAPL